MNNSTQFEVKFHAGRYECRKRGFAGRVFADSPEKAVKMAQSFRWTHTQFEEMLSNRAKKRIERQLRWMSAQEVQP